MGDFDFHFIALHLKAMFDYDSIKRREKELEKLRDWIEAQLSTDKDVIIVGDMNERLDSSPFAKLNENNKFYFCTSELSCDYSYSGSLGNSFLVGVQSSCKSESSFGSSIKEILSFLNIIPIFCWPPDSPILYP